MNPTLPVDFEAALHLFDNDRDFMLEMFHDYEAGLPERLKEIQAAFQANQVETLCRHAHSLKGASLSFCAQPVVETAKQVEESCRRGEMDDMPELMARLEEEVQRLMRYLADNLPH